MHKPEILMQIYSQVIEAQNISEMKAHLEITQRNFNHEGNVPSVFPDYTCKNVHVVAHLWL